MEKISVIKYSDGERKIKEGKTEVVNIDVPYWTLEKIEELKRTSYEKINRILDLYYPEDWSEWICVIRWIDIDLILND